MDDANDVLREILQWIRFQNRQALRVVLEETLTTETDKKIYELSDGQHSQPAIAKQAGVSQPTVSNKWKAWKGYGIAYELENEPGRCRHLASLQSLGIRV